MTFSLMHVVAVQFYITFCKLLTSADVRAQIWSAAGQMKAGEEQSQQHYYIL